ncbi:MAG: hypothetical protein CMH55_07790 [Myxococcales bacterium]|nr:hypothetical protein [Myxococcales bacterium]|tara:strand:+ start:140 stop:610 length:471 start_codon:yes stop_codon:yes gene_type:complete
MVDVNRYSPQGIIALGSVLPAGAGDYEGGAVKMMLLNDTTTIDTEWDDPAKVEIDDFTTKGEYAGSGYARQTLANVTLTQVGTRVYLDFDDVVISTLGATGTLEHALIYVEKTGAAAYPAFTDRIQLCLLSLSSQPDGTDYTIAPPVGGISLWETA